MSYYIIVNSSELYHHGVKGMKWGVRHERKTSGGGRIKIKNPMDSYRASLAKKYKSKYEMTDKEAEVAAQEHARRVRNVAIGVAVVTGAAVGTSFAMQYGRRYCDDVIKAGAKLQTVHERPDIMNSGKFYTAYKEMDKVKYKGMFGEVTDMFGWGTGKAKNVITADVDSDIKAIGVHNANKLYKSLVKNNKEFADAVQSVSGSGRINYKNFNHMGLLGDGRYAKIKDAKRAQEIFYDAAKKKGYGAIADWNDRINSGYNTHANIVFDTSAIKNISSRRMSMDEVNNAKTTALGRVLLEQSLSTKNLVKYGFAAGYLGGKAAGAKTERNLNKKYKKKTIKSEVQNNDVFYWESN